ncbi:unnamed protein product, partial [Scytosiphon promiscuus]
CRVQSWYYPHLYAPLASSMTNLMDMDISFEKGRYGVFCPF